MISRPFKTTVAVLATTMGLTVCAAGQQFTLTLTDHNSPTSWVETRGILPWAKRVEEATKRRVKIQVFPSQTLVKGPDAWKAMKAGIVDICWCFHGYWPDMTPLADVISLPGVPFVTAEKGSEILWKLYERFPVLQKEFSDAKPLLMFTTHPYILITTKKQVKTLEDMKGLKIRVAGGPPTDQIKALGAVPTLIPMPDNYAAMEKGVIDGMGAPWEAIYGFRFYEVVKYYTTVPLSAVYFSLSMNKKRWNSLPKDIQDAIMSVSALEGSKAFGKGTYDDAEQDVLAVIKAGKHEMVRYVVPPEELARWRQVAGEPIWQDWVKRMEAKGRPQAKELLAAMLEMAKN